MLRADPARGRRTGAANAIVGRRWLPFVVGYLLLWGTLAGLAEVDATGRWGLLILAAVAGCAVVVERVVFRTPLPAAVRFLGLGRPTGWSLAVGALAAGAVLLLYPVGQALTGERFALVDDWPWILLGLFAFHGLAEEIVWRGFVFRRLHAGRSFRAAVVWTMPFIAAAHLPMLLSNGLVVAIGALLVAAVTSVPLGYLYLTGRGTIWAAALVHTAIDSFKLVTVPPAAAPTFSLLLISFSLVAPLLVFVLPRRKPHHVP